MAGGKFFNQTGDSSELVSREGVTDYEDPAVRALVVEESNREPDEIIPVSGHQTSFLSGSKSSWI